MGRERERDTGRCLSRVSLGNVRRVGGARSQEEEEEEEEEQGRREIKEWHRTDC